MANKKVVLNLQLRYLPFTVLFLFFFSKHTPAGYHAFHITGFAQGTTYHITYYAEDSTVVAAQIDSILAQIDHSLSIYNPSSLISQFNQSRGPIRMDIHFKNVVKRSLEINADSKGIFDLTVYPLVQAWGFGPVKADSLPGKQQIDLIKQCIGSDLLQVKGDSLYKLKPCVKLDPNGIAQGYSVDVLADFFEQHGIQNYLIELGGEIRAKGKKQPGNLPLHVGIEAPADNEFTDAGIEKIVTINNGAITTSGSYRKFKESNGKKISHLIDPRTGYPSVNELISVTVYATDGITADGYDNTLMVMGLDSAMKFTEARKDIAAYFIYRKKDGRLSDTATSKFYTLLKR